MKEYMKLMTKTDGNKNYGPAPVHESLVAAYEKDGWVLVNPPKEEPKQRQRRVED